jgi:hypothetical protein
LDLLLGLVVETFGGTGNGTSPYWYRSSTTKIFSVIKLGRPRDTREIIELSCMLRGRHDTLFAGNFSYPFVKLFCWKAFACRQIDSKVGSVQYMKFVVRLDYTENLYAQVHRVPIPTYLLVYIELPVEEVGLPYYSKHRTLQSFMRL